VKETCLCKQINNNQQTIKTAKSERNKTKSYPNDIIEPNVLNLRLFVYNLHNGLCFLNTSSNISIWTYVPSKAVLKFCCCCCFFYLEVSYESPHRNDASLL